MVIHVPYTRMNDAMRMVLRMGGKTTGITVNGGNLGSTKIVPTRKETTSKLENG